VPPRMWGSQPTMYAVADSPADPVRSNTRTDSASILIASPDTFNAKLTNRIRNSATANTSLNVACRMRALPTVPSAQRPQVDPEPHAMSKLWEKTEGSKAGGAVDQDRGEPRRPAGMPVRDISADGDDARAVGAVRAPRRRNAPRVGGPVAAALPRTAPAAPRPPGGQ